MSLPAYKMDEEVAEGYLQRNQCPICIAAISKSKPEMQSEPPAENLPSEMHTGYFPTERARRVFFTYNRCNDCGGLYCPTYFTQSELDLLYRNQNENMVDVPLASRAATQRAYVDVIKRFAPLTGNYLEIGPDIGLFTEALAAAGQFDHFYLYEPNETVHAELTRKMQGRKIHISTELYRPGLVPKGSLNLAVIIHALDHLLDPEAMLRAIYDDLQPGGSVLIVTHDEGSPLAKILGAKWPPYTLQHPQLFRRASMRRLVERCGFKLSGFAGTPNYFPLHYLVRRALGLAGLDHLVKGWNNSPDLRLQLGNLGTVCQKPF